MTVADGTYYLTANTGKTLAVDGCLDEDAPVKLVTKSNVSGHAKIRQLWKIKYLGEGYYSIRSLYKADRCIKVASNAAKLHVVDTYDHISYFDDNALWKIENVGTGYLLQNCWTENTKQCLKASDEAATVSTYWTGESSFVWSLMADTSVPDMLLLIDTNTALPVTNPSKTIYGFGTTDLDELDLVISFISQTTNEQYAIGWESSNTSVATVGSSTGIVVPRAAGTTVIKASHPSAYNTVQYTATVPQPYTVNLDVIYDEGHAERYNNNSIAQITPQLEDLQNIFWNEFGIYVNYSTPTQYESLADTCPAGINQPCTCFGNNCENADYYDNGVAISRSLHHKNIYNIHADIAHPDTSQTLRIAFTGHHKLCESNGGVCAEGTLLHGLAFKLAGIALVKDSRDDINPAIITVHEFGHFYGAVDHYGGDEATTLDMNGGNEDGPYSRSCIYGEDAYLDDEIFICDGCRATIYANRDDYNHS